MTADQTREQKLVEYLKRVTGELVEAKERAAALEAARTQPLAVIGMSCRFPGGGDTPARYWQALRDGVDAVTEVPADRWPAADYLDPDPTAPGKAYTQSGGFLPDVAGWDAAFFGVSPQEAVRIDPQHRLLMELVWEGLEDAGIAAERLRGSRTGVFVGLSDSRQYLELESEAEGVSCLDDPHLTMGGAPNAAAGRLAYHFDLRGPCLTVDTACSSALMATHLAVQSLRRGECDLAVVCASSSMVHPAFFVQFSKMGMLARDGRAKVFDEAGDGYVLGEGGGAIVLARASDAERAGNRVHGLIRGSAVTQDGRSNGMTAPNKQAQVAVLRSALADAGLRPDDLDFLESQGTGSALGDAIEFGALLEVFGDRSAGHPLLVGAVKSNIGHLVASSGIASLIKSLLVLRHGEVPTNLHLSNPNPVVTLDGPVRPVQGRQPLASTPDAPRRAGVSAFGWSGTNVHLVVEQAPATAAPETAADLETGPDWQLLTLSAAGEASLRAAATALADHLESTADLPLADVAHTVRTGRAALRLRRTLVCRDTADAVARLRAEAPGTEAPAGRQTVGLVLPGDTGLDAVAELRRTEPALREALEKCAALLAEKHGTELDAAGPHVTAFATEYALGTLLVASGVPVGAVAGTGAGTHAAGCLAGAHDLAAGLALAYALDTGAPAEPAEAPAQPPRIPVAASPADLAGRVDVVATLGEPTGPDQVRLRSGVPGRREWLTAVGRLWERGVTVDWTAGGPRGRVVDLPTYPFQRIRFWPKRDQSAGPILPAAEAAPPPAERYPRPDVRASFLAPRTPTERTVAGIWQDHLAIEEIGVHDPFFELGGTSVVGVAMVNRLAKEFEVELTAASLFERPTVAEFAELLDELRGTAGDTPPAASPSPSSTKSTVDAQAERGARRRALANARTRNR